MREALKLALDALDIVKIHFTQNRHVNEAITAIKEALAQPAQEPVAWAVYHKRGGSKSLHWPENHSPNGDATMFDAVPLVPQRPWVGLTDEDITKSYEEAYKVAQGRRLEVAFARVVETKLKELNT